MLRYSKIFSLALLVSIPSIAMELYDIAPGEQNQEEATAASTSPNELTQTIFVGKEYVNSLAHLIEVERKKQELDQEELTARESRNTALQNLLAKKTAKEQSRDGAQVIVDDAAARLLALQNRKLRTQELVTENQQEELTALEDQMSQLTIQKDTALRDKEVHETALRNICELIEKTGLKPSVASETPAPAQITETSVSAQVSETKEPTVKEDPKPAASAQKKGHWYFFWLF